MRSLVCAAPSLTVGFSAGISVHRLRAALSATGGKALTAQDRATRLGFEGNTVTLPALIANNLESFALAATTAAPSALAGAAKVGAPRVTAWLATFRMR